MPDSATRDLDHRGREEGNGGLATARGTAPHPPGSAGKSLRGLQRPLAGQRVELPRAQGTLAVWPGWTLHRVDPIMDGERWALAVFGYGPSLQ